MSNCETYFETDDAVKSCSRTLVPPNVVCTAINLPYVYTTIYRHPPDFQSNAVGTQPLKVTSHKLNWCLSHQLSDVQPYLSWIQFSYLVNQKYMVERNANFQDCLTNGNEVVLVSCSNSNYGFTIETIGPCVSARYSKLFDTQIDHYKRLLASLIDWWLLWLLVTVI